LDQISKLNRSDIPTYVSSYNKLLGEISTIESYTCSNNCESCFLYGTDTNKTCGLLSFESIISLQYLEGNYTFEELTNGVGGIMDARHYTSTCIDYITAPYNGKLCVTLDLMGITSGNETVPCNFTYDNTSCNSCVIPPDYVQECVLADCTNIDPNAMINTCEKTGLVGPFQYFGLLPTNESVVDNTTFTPGRCSDDGGSVSGETPVAPPVAALSNAPIDPKVTSPSTAPTPESILIMAPNVGAPATNVAKPTYPTSDSCYLHFPSLMILITLITVPLVTFR
jgi:hypothetical protein